jgi:hypothetical protein
MKKIGKNIDTKLASLINICKNITPNFTRMQFGITIKMQGAILTTKLLYKLSPSFRPIVFKLFPFIAKSDNCLQVNFSQFLANRNYTRIALGSYRISRKLPISIIDSIIKLLYSHTGEKARSIITDYFSSIAKRISGHLSLMKQIKQMNPEISREPIPFVTHDFFCKHIAMRTSSGKKNYRASTNATYIEINF